MASESITKWFRKNIGSVIAVISLLILAILSFGDLGELFTEQYWENVGGNLSSIGAVTIGLVFVQTSLKQGVSEQALSAGLNTTDTKDKYKEHRKIRKDCQEKEIYLPYFLDLRNRRETKRRKREFLVDNGFKSEKMLMLSGKKRLISAYQKILTNMTADSIKWSTTEIIYNKNGRIQKLDAYRRTRFWKGLLSGLFTMIGTAFITGGLFLDTADIPFWQKLIKFFTYLIPIAISALFDVLKNYEKGAFGVPNELEEVNSIWEEFFDWEVPEWVIKEVEENNLPDVSENEDVAKEGKVPDENNDNNQKKVVVKKEEPILLGYIEKEIKEEIESDSREEAIDISSDIQEESEQGEDI